MSQVNLFVLQDIMDLLASIHALQDFMVKIVSQNANVNTVGSVILSLVNVHALLVGRLWIVVNHVQMIFMVQIAVKNVNVSMMHNVERMMVIVCVKLVGWEIVVKKVSFDFFLQLQVL